MTLSLILTLERCFDSSLTEYAISASCRFVNRRELGVSADIGVIVPVGFAALTLRPSARWLSSSLWTKHAVDAFLVETREPLRLCEPCESKTTFSCSVSNELLVGLLGDNNQDADLDWRVETPIACTAIGGLPIGNKESALERSRRARGEPTSSAERSSMDS